MQQLLKAKWFLVLKWIIAFTSVFYIAYHITRRAHSVNIQTIFSLLQQNDSASLSLIVLILLMMLNWLIESLKWKLIIEDVEKISLLKSLRAVLTGLTLSFYSPNRTGEFLGRVMHLQPEHRVRASLLTFVGSIAQLIITLQAGSIAALFYLFPQTTMRTYRGFNFQSLSIFIIVLISFIFLFNIAKWMEQLKRINFLKKYAAKFDVLQKLSNQKLMVVYLLSVFRYLIFAFQFYLLLRLCNINLSTFEMIINIALSFMLTSLIPSIALGELGVRGSVNLSLFSLNHANDSAVLVASFLLWLINLAIPALIGAMCSFYIKWNKSAQR